MNRMLKSTKVLFIAFALAALLTLPTAIVSSRNRATANESATEPATNSVTTSVAMLNANPNAAPCAPEITCDSPNPSPAFAATNSNSIGTGMVGRGGMTGGYFEANSKDGFGVFAKNLAGGIGLLGQTMGQDGTGVVGRYDGPASKGGWGVHGHSEAGFAGVFGSGGGYGVYGHVNNKGGSGVYGKNDGGGQGVFGQVTQEGGSGVLGRYDGPATGGGWGVFGWSERGFAGVFGSGRGYGVFGLTGNTTQDNVAGVYGKNDGIGMGVFGQNKSTKAAAVLGRNDGGGDGVAGFSTGGGRASGVWGGTDSPEGFGGTFTNTAGGLALNVDGRAKVKVLEITGADLSEQFEVKGVFASGREASHERVQPGLVVSIDPETAGKLVISRQAYDHRVAGIISGAGGINPGVLMNKPASIGDGSHPVALTGRVYCWADASSGAIKPGDFLTTSTTPGHAMKATNRQKAIGAIIGKAMTELKSGKGLVLVLVSLQ